MAKWIEGRGLRRALLALACLCAAAAATALAAGCGSSNDADRPARRVVQVVQAPRDRWTYARARFRELCAGCHTLADAGAHGPRFSLDVIGEISESRARYVIADGEPGMPAWTGVLSRREYEELAAYVSSVEKQVQGDDRWQWQIKLRSEGELWRPGDVRRTRPEDLKITDSLP